MNFLSYHSKQLGFAYSLLSINDSIKNPPWVLTEREQKTLATFKNEKRRREWLAGRFAAKWAKLKENKNEDWVLHIKPLK